MFNKSYLCHIESDYKQTNVFQLYNTHSYPLFFKFNGVIIFKDLVTHLIICLKFLQKFIILIILKNTLKRYEMKTLLKNILEQRLFFKFWVTLIYVSLWLLILVTNKTMFIWIKHIGKFSKNFHYTRNDILFLISCRSYQQEYHLFQCIVEINLFLLICFISRQCSLLTNSWFVN